MWETTAPTAATVHLSHDLPCQRCGHAIHTYLPCGDHCACPPVVLPGVQAA